jgi:hypothetical protein
MHISTFEYLGPTQQQVALMQEARDAVGVYASVLERVCDDGPDKTYLMRKLREVAMWANIAITRNPDGSPRS